MKHSITRKISIILTVFLLAALFSPGAPLGFKDSATKVEAAMVQYKTNANLNLRKGPSPKQKVIMTIPKGKTVTYVSKSGSWYKVKYGTKTGYVSSKYLTKVTTKKSTNVKADTVQYKTTAALNLRKGPSTKQKVIMTIPKGKTVTYISKSGSWYKVKYGTKTGYVSSKYLTKVTTKKSSSYEIPILMYHHIDEYKGKGLKGLYVTPKNFEAQMKYLKSAGFTPITFDDIKNIKNIKKPVLITLDDGDKDHMNAYNILKKLNSKTFKSKATFFVIGRKIDKNGLSSAQLKQISDSGIVSVQSHTMTHPSLPIAKDYKKELKDIKTMIEKITKKPVTAIAYPSGEFNSKVISETKKYYKYAVTTKPGLADTGSSLYEMKRVRISYETSLSSFKRMVNQ